MLSFKQIATEGLSPGTNHNYIARLGFFHSVVSVVISIVVNSFRLENIVTAYITSTNAIKNVYSDAISAISGLTKKSDIITSSTTANNRVDIVTKVDNLVEADVLSDNYIQSNISIINTLNNDVMSDTSLNTSLETQSSIEAISDSSNAIEAQVK